MLLQLPTLLSASELAQARLWLADEAAWIDGRSTAGGQAMGQKNNRQLRQNSAQAGPLQALILAALQRQPLFFSAALPKRILPPLFNRYGGSHNAYGPHFDGAMLKWPDSPAQAPQWLRSDLSCTVFLSEPGDYDGGALRVHDNGGDRDIKLSAGDAVLYPANRVHEVTPVTRGERLAAFFWVESMVRSEEQRRLLFELDMNLLKLRSQLGDTAETTALTGVYHNLLRQWAQG